MFAFRKPVIIAVAGALALTACTENTNRTQAGAATGAVLGGLFGATRDGDNQALKTAAGAAIGAAVGGAIGQQLDRQKAELDQGFANNDIDVINTGSELIVRMPNAILFDTDSAAVRPQLRSDLNVLSGNLLRYPNSTVFVVGHTDSTGTAAYNQNLSQRRAQAVASVLTAGGVAPARIVATGRGEDQPIASNLTPEGRQLNRRVEITIRPNQ
jgi:outer membrane protein OmpA-like peptidoglycan-associated protein